MPAVLHISDLHRTPRHHLTNDELLSALGSDSQRWEAEGIPRPDLIVVSGDLVQGVALEDCDHDARIADQYREADAFLNQLAEDMLESDRSRIVIVPGNHDVHWRQSRDAMKPICSCPDDVATKSLLPTSGLRWDWNDRRAYTISDPASYADRLKHFRRFRYDFYNGVEPSPFAQDGEDLVFFEYPDLGLCVAGFSSCHGNDCFCRVGSIETLSLASAQRLISGSSAETAVAVWHHSITGGPREHDYLDHHVVHKLIDSGFTVGLHGHQHYPDAAPFNLRLPNLTSMAVVGAGSLAAGDDALPMGERRQFNVVVIDPDCASITVHVRAMSAGGVFTGSARADFGGRSFIKLELPPKRMNRRKSDGLQRLDEAMTAIAEGRHHDALEQIPRIASSYAQAKRQIALEAMRGLGRREELIELLIPPQSQTEVVELVSLLLDLERINEAKTLLDESESLMNKDTSIELRNTIAAREMLP